ncbi:MAG: C-terminal binding protein [Spirochaetes bacterium]|nr:C-terminal binding protein [Spirochaetota bacterium]
MYKIVFTDYYYPTNEMEVEILKKLGDVDIVDCMRIKEGGVKDEDGVIRYAKDADAIIVQFADISKKVIEHLTKCRIIARYAIGVDNIDVEEAKRRNIVVSNVPDYCVEEVSDSAVAFIFNAIRKTSFANYLLQNGAWSYEKIRPIRRASDITIGLLAFGNIAQRVAEKLRSSNTTIVAHDPYYKHHEGEFPWVKFLSFEELLSSSDILSIHAPLNKETHHLIDRDSIALMKEGVSIINTSRGGLIDENALEEAIKSRKVSVVGLDVLEYPDDKYTDSVLLKYPERVIITPHIGWYSEESIGELQRKTALNVYEMLTKNKPLYAV